MRSKLQISLLLSLGAISALGCDQKCLTDCSTGGSTLNAGEQERELVAAVTLADEVQKAKEVVDESFKLQSALASCETKEKEIALRQETAHYVTAYGKLQVTKDKFDEKLRVCGLRKGCDMSCVRECSFWTDGHWANCFNQCHCLGLEQDTQEINDYQQHGGVNVEHKVGLDGGLSHNWGSSVQAAWAWLSLDGNNKCHSETYFHDGSHASHSCPSSVECFHHGVSDEAARAALQLNKEMRSAAAAIYQFYLGEDSNVTVSKQSQLEEGVGQVALKHGNDTVLFSVYTQESKLHSYEVSFIDEDGEEQLYGVFLYQNLDGSFTGILGNYSTFIFLQSYKINFIENEASLGGFTIQVKQADFTQETHQYFGGIRESMLKKYGVWNEWVSMTETEHAHDLGFNTTETIYTFGQCKRRYTDIETHIHNVIVTNRTYELPKPNLDFHLWDNVTSIEHKYTFNSTTVHTNGSTVVHESMFDIVYYGNLTFRLYSNGSVYTNEFNETFLVDGGVDGLKEYLNTHYTGATILSDYTLVHFGEQEYKWFHDLKSEDNSTGSVVNSDGETITQDGLVGLRKYLAPKYQVVIVNGATYWVWNSGRVSTTANETVVSEGGIDNLKAHLKPKFTTYIINGASYKIYQNGKVEDAEGKVVLQEGGVSALLKTLTRDGKFIFKTKSTVIINGLYYRIFANGTVVDEEGNTIFVTGGIDALRNKFFGYTLTTVNGENYKVYVNGTVTTFDGTVIAEEGGEKALVAWYEENKSNSILTVIMCNNWIVKIFDNHTITTTNGVALDKYYSHQYANDFCGDFENKNYITAVYNGEYFRIFFDGNVTKAATGELISQDGAEGFDKYMNFTNVPTTIVTLQGIDEQFIIRYDDEFSVWDASNEKQLTNGGYMGLISYLQEKNRIFTIFHWFNHVYKYFPGNNTINFVNDVYFMTGNSTTFMEFTETHQLVSFQTENGQYDLYLDIYQEEESFCVDPNNELIEGCYTIADLLFVLDDYVADVMSVVVHNNSYTLTDGVCTDYYGNVVEGITTFEQLDQLASDSRVSELTTIWTINGIYKFTQVNNGNFTDADGKDLGIGNQVSSLWKWAEENLSAGDIKLSVYDSNSEFQSKPLTVFDIYQDGEVYNYGLIMKNSSVQGVLDLINTYSTQTQIFSVMNQQIYTVHNYDTKVYDGEGNFVCNNGREGLAEYLYQKYHTKNFTWQVDDAQFHCDFTGYCVDFLGNDARFFKYFQAIDTLRKFSTDNENVYRIEVIKNGTARDIYWHIDSGKVYIDEDIEENLFAEKVQYLDQLSTIVSFFWRTDLLVDYFFSYQNNSNHLQYNVYSGLWYDVEGNLLSEDLQSYKDIRSALYSEWMDRTIWTINGAEFTVTTDGQCFWADGQEVDVENCDISKLKTYLQENWGGVWTRVTAVHEGKQDSFTFFHNGTLVADDEDVQASIGNKTFEDLEAVKKWFELEFDCGGNVVFAYYKTREGDVIQRLSKKYNLGDDGTVTDQEGNVITEDGIEGLKEILGAKTISVYRFFFGGEIVGLFQQEGDQLFDITNATNRIEIDVSETTIKEYLQKWYDEHDVPYVKFSVEVTDWEEETHKSDTYKLWEKEDGTWTATQLVNGTDVVVVENIESKELLKNKVIEDFQAEIGLKIRITVVVAEEDEADHIAPEVHTFLYDKYGSKSVVYSNDTSIVFLEKADSIEDIQEEFQVKSVWSNIALTINEGEYNFIIHANDTVTDKATGEIVCSNWTGNEDVCLSSYGIQGDTRYLRYQVEENDICVKYGFRMDVYMECIIQQDADGNRQRLLTCFKRNATTHEVIESVNYTSTAQANYEYEQENSYVVFTRGFKMLNPYNDNNDILNVDKYIIYKNSEKKYYGIIPDQVTELTLNESVTNIKAGATQLFDREEIKYGEEVKLSFFDPKRQQDVSIGTMQFYYLEKCEEDQLNCPGMLFGRIRGPLSEPFAQYGVQDGMITTRARMDSKINDILSSTRLYDSETIEGQYYEIWAHGLVELVNQTDESDRETVKTNCTSVACMTNYILEGEVDTSLNTHMKPLAALEDTRPDPLDIELIQYFYEQSSASYAVVALLVAAATVFIAKKKMEKPEFDAELREQLLPRQFTA